MKTTNLAMRHSIPKSRGHDPWPSPCSKPQRLGSKENEQRRFASPLIKHSTSGNISSAALGCRLQDARNVSTGAAVAAATASPDEKGEFAAVAWPSCALLLLCNMDRINISVVMLTLSRQFAWTEGTQGMIQSAFLWGYAATQMLGGSLADRYGGKIVIAYALILFSLSSLLLPLCITPTVHSLGIMLPLVVMSRAMVGVGEGVVMPSINSLISRLVPFHLKSTALGVVFLGFNLGSACGLWMSGYLLAMFAWQSVFLVCGALGLPVLLLWIATVPSKDTCTKTNAKAATKLDDNPPVNLATALTKLPVWAVIVATSVNHWGYFVCLGWMPTYFNKVLGLNIRASGYFSIVPWLTMALISLVSGIVADQAIANGAAVLLVRRWAQSIAFLVPAIMCYWLSNPGISPTLAVVCFTLILGAKSIGQAGFVANSSDIAPKNAGSIYGLANTCGSISGLLGMWGVGIIVERFQSFAPVFQLTGVFYIFGTLFWNCFCSAEPVV